MWGWDTAGLIGVKKCPKVSQSVRYCPLFSKSVPLSATMCHFPVLEPGLDAVAGSGAVAFFGINDLGVLERVSDEGSLCNGTGVL